MTTSTKAEQDLDLHRNAPRPTEAMLYGLAGEVGRAAAATTEANRYAVAMNYLTMLSAAVGRDVYFSIGDTRHHARLFTMHVGRTSRGRKGDAHGLPQRIRRKIEEQRGTGTEPICGQIHTGGLSTREGLTLIIHDGFEQGKDEVPAIADKRLYIIESEFANVLHQAKRDGNTLSAALRDAWDGTSIYPATKTNKVGTTDPHIAMSGSITPSELLSLMQSRELSNGFANRYQIIWAERERIEPFPQPTPQDVVDSLASRTGDVIRFAKGKYPATKDSRLMTLSEAAKSEYGRLYRKELNSVQDGDRVMAVLERRAPIVLRWAMLFALTDQVLVIEVKHLNAAMAWSRYHRDSVRFIFNDAAGEEAAKESNNAAGKIVAYLRGQDGLVSRLDLYKKCFASHISASRLDSALDSLLLDSPPRIELVEGDPAENGKRPKSYKLVGESGESAKWAAAQGSSQNRPSANQANQANWDDSMPASDSPSSPSSHYRESAETLANRASSQIRQVRTAVEDCPF